MTPRRTGRVVLGLALCWLFIPPTILGVASSMYGIPIGAEPVDVALVDLDRDGRLEIVVLVNRLTPEASAAIKLPSPDVGSVLVFRTERDGTVWKRSETILYREVALKITHPGGYEVRKEALVGWAPSHLLVTGYHARKLDRVFVVYHRFRGIYDLSGPTLGTVLLLNWEKFWLTRRLADLMLVEDDSFMAIADLDTDGINDAVLVTPADRQVRVLRGDGKGNFVEHWKTVVGERRGDEPRFVTVANLAQFPGYPGELSVVIALGGIISDQVQIISSLGDGRFVVGEPFMTTLRPRSVVCGDFNNDGRPDLVVAGVNAFVFHPGVGLSPKGVPLFGRKQPGGDVSVPADFVRPISMAAVDVNLDNKLDLIIANYGAGTVDIWLGNGDGSFSRSQRIPLEKEARPIALAAGDLNDDFWADLVVVCQGTNNLVVLPNMGGFYMTRPPWFFPAFPGRLFAVGQIDGRGGDDIVRTYYLESDVGPSVRRATILDKPDWKKGEDLVDVVLSATLLHTCPGLRKVKTSAVSAPKVITKEDFDPAMLAKAIAEKKFTEAQAASLAMATDTVKEAELTGTLVELVPEAKDPCDTKRLTRAVVSGLYPAAIGAGDLDGDGIAEVVLVDPNTRRISAIKWFEVRKEVGKKQYWELGVLGSVFQEYELYRETRRWPIPTSVVLADFDPKTPGLEIAVLNARSNDVLILRVSYDKKRGFTKLLSADVVGLGVVGGMPIAGLALDLNRDGRLDLVVANVESNDLSLLIRNQRDFGDWDQVLFDERRFKDAKIDRPVALAIGDLDGDKIEEIIVAAYGAKALAVLKVGVDGTLRVHTESIKTVKAPYSIALADFTADGKLDIAAVSAAGLEVFAGKGDGTAVKVLLVRPSELGGEPLWVGAGDFNQDRIADIAVGVAKPGDLGWICANVWVRYGPLTGP